MNPSRYNFSGSRRKKVVGSYLKEIATYEPKRSMSNARLINTILTLLGAIFLAYCSLFYIPALFKMNIIMGSSTSQDHINSIETQRKTSWYQPALSFLHMKRGYFQAGSEIRVAYNSTEGSKVTLFYSQCSGIPVVEIFSCPPGPVHKYEAEGHQGEARIRVHKNGFYYFAEDVKYNSDTGNYVIVWGR